jgi:hypothetical protein
MNRTNISTLYSPNIFEQGGGKPVIQTKKNKVDSYDSSEQSLTSTSKLTSTSILTKANRELTRDLNKLRDELNQVKKELEQTKSKLNKYEQ